ncbi:MAG TPA: NADH-quinone oxidoreductase subunit NuoG, partial [Gammaproteobacteria bacterium]|nr:NADH-quinone oxidoreductase subunit NuoG [Gammaproteobacteria bacterium]
LDCPICDQGGECELQDLALGYGRSVSRFTEKKRVVQDKNIGPLISTDMTRCIHCTRCVRFLEEIAGYKELGGTGRGENVEIGTYVERAIESEMSGNVIDVCPVGALTSKPFRFAARAWELTQHPTVAPHDSVGSNLFLHTRRGEALRVVPRENEAVNEVWLSDRDRFSYQGINSSERLQTPMVKVDGVWKEVEWETALQTVADRLRGVIETHGPEQLGMLVSPTATLEEMYLAGKLAEGLGCSNVDHRLRQVDFSDQDRAPRFPWLGQSIEDLERVDAALLIGSNVRKDLPIVGHRLRKASLAGAKLMFINPVDYQFRFKVAAKAIVQPSRMVAELAAVAAAVLAAKGVQAPADLKALVDSAQPGETHQAMAQALTDGERATVLLGNGANAHPAFSALRALAALIAEHSEAVLGYLPEAADSAGGWLAGALPHRQADGTPREAVGLHARAMIEQPRKGYLLFGVEPEYDCFDGCLARRAMDEAEFVVALTSFTSEALQSYADVLLPLGVFTETSGTYINLEGRWQGFAGASRPVGDARPGWKILRVLGNLCGCGGFDYMSSEQVRDDVRNRVGRGTRNNRLQPGAVAGTTPGDLERVGDVPIYAFDPLVRRATALQHTDDGADAVVRICLAQAEQLGIADAERVTVRQGECSATLPLVIDERVARGCAWIPAARPSSVTLGGAFGTVKLQKA